MDSMDKLNKIMHLATMFGAFDEPKQSSNRPICKFRNERGKCDKKMGLCNGYKSKLHCKKRS